MERRIPNKSEKNLDLYIIPKGRFIYQKTIHDNLWPGNVLEPFIATKGTFSRHHKLTEFTSISSTTLFYDGKKRTLYQGSIFYAFTKGLKMVK